MTFDILNNSLLEVDPDLPNAVDSMGRNYTSSAVAGDWRNRLMPGERFTGTVVFAPGISTTSATLDVTLTLTFASIVPTRDASADATASAQGTPLTAVGPALSRSLMKLERIQLP